MQPDEILEYKKDSSHSSISIINNILQDTEKKALVTIYINFISCYAKEFVQDLDFFQRQNKPIFPFVEGRLEQLTSYLEGNCNAEYFGLDLQSLITQYQFNPKNIYIIFHTEKKALVTIYINFISCYAKEFVQDLDFFQRQNKPIFPFVEGRLEQLTSYLEGNCNAEYFGLDLQSLITQYQFNPKNIYIIFPKRLAQYHNYFPELTNLHSSLKSYSVCEKHYNQIIVTNYFYKHFTELNQENKRIPENENKRLRSDSDKDNSIDHSDTMDELNETKSLLEASYLEIHQKSQLVIDLNNQILRMQQHIEDQRNEIDELKQKLQRAYDNMIEIQDLYKEQSKAEREALFDDIESLIKDNDRFAVESLMVYSPYEWLNKCNQVIVKFIEILIQNNQETDHSRQEKLFKTAIAINIIYEARHGKYVSEIHLAASAIKYSIARSKIIINIDNHLISLGSYYQFQKWLEELSEHEEKLPESLLFLAFNNEQRGQKNYLDRGFNTIIFHIITSFVAFNMGSQNKIQSTNSPWLHSSLNRLQCEELFDINPQMQEVIDMELHAYLSEIFKLLHEEKLAPVNTIDSLMVTAANITAMKECPNCNQKNIKNRKQICPRCKERLPTLAKIQNEKSIENNVIDQQSKPLIFKPYSINDESSSVSVPRISFTQQQIIEQGVNIPEIYIPDPININPNSIANVKKVLSHIKTISSIKDGSHKWVAVTCDGVPYHHAAKLKEKFPWLVLLPGEIDLKQFASCQGYRTENQLAYFKKSPSVEGYLVWVNEQQDPLYRTKYEQTFVYLQAIINYQKAIRTNNSFLKKAAKRSFSPI
ncbi:hypothetical protein Glove_50g130 [Diversispora epigaea]|uniref:Uncharacterized protein n=1 Tax=Diversispora epigaea TaxID=1348612 RepID=A0A397JIA1_9GLOM|nr:hypothetical protein Glove_50g130 [Diversispora epigaea]